MHASIYHVAPQEHGISENALTQAQAEAIKAGYEYIQSEMEYIARDKDIASLKRLRSQYQMKRTSALKLG
jgi:hypothetical protein